MTATKTKTRPAGGTGHKYPPFNRETLSARLQLKIAPSMRANVDKAARAQYPKYASAADYIRAAIAEKLAQDI